MHPTDSDMLRRVWRWLMIACGVLSLTAGAIGIFLPLVPTAPFVLLAAFFFARGSERLHRWLTGHPHFGHHVRDWEAEQVIPPAGKYAATLVMVPSVSWVLLTRDLPWVLQGGMAVTVIGVLWFIWSRPSRRSAAAAPIEPATKSASGIPVDRPPV